MLRRAIANRWAAVPVLMLSCTICGAALVLTLSFANPNVTAAEPDYYRKAATWDDYRRQLAENGALGWVVTPEFVAGKIDPTLARLEVSVADKYGIDIAKASVHAELIPIRAADSRLTLQLQEDFPGHYGADVPLRVNGMWEVRTTIESKNHTYCDRVRRHLTFGKQQADAPAMLQGEATP